MLAKTLLRYPMMVHLLFKQAQCLLKFKYFEYAVKIAKVCIDLCPTSFEAWMLYAECLIELQDLKGALIALDLAPNSPDLPYIDLPEPQTTYDLSIPMKLTSTDCFQHFMLPLNDVIDYSVPSTPSENVSILQLNVWRRMPEPYQDDIC